MQQLRYLDKQEAAELCTLLRADGYRAVLTTDGTTYTVHTDAPQPVCITTTEG